MNLRGVYESGIESCFSFVPNLGIWKILGGMLRSWCRNGGPRDLPKSAASNTDEPLGAQLSGETPCIVKVLEDEWGEVHKILVSVVKP